MPPKRSSQRKSAAKAKAKGKVVARGAVVKGARRARLPKGAVRGSSCLPCLKSAISGKDKGDPCRDTQPAGNRCWRCDSGHSCTAIPKIAAAPAAKFLAAKEANDAKEIRFWRPVVRGMLRLAAELDADDNDNNDIANMTANEKKEAGQKAFARLGALLFP
ncbi:hypothetical protein GQ53DRAFT_806071 [Thozetella sp. PMI_491]|nr:hypothetical protein GQ53DRAFT_806071 [Thozetella sp. PMI_491]